VVVGAEAGKAERVMRSWRSPAVLAAVILATTLSGGVVPRWESELASANGTGTGSGDDRWYAPVLSPDGTKVAFTSDASNLGPTDTNGLSDAYVRDLTTGITTLVSVDVTGSDSGDGESGALWSGAFSPDGTKLLFSSTSTDLVSSGTSGSVSDLYVRDLVAGTTELVTAAADGTKIAFVSRATSSARPTPTRPTTSTSATRRPRPTGWSRSTPPVTTRPAATRASSSTSAVPRSSSSGSR
jgi:Tol biopolymer transport system component